MAERFSTPQSDEVEVSLFGPGYGECILVHLGCGEWLIVDSCWDATMNNQPAIQYLRELGSDPARCVSRVVATHWHDDHAKGISEVVRVCASATLHFSQALTEDEFLDVVGTRGRDETVMKPGVREFYRVWQELTSRAGGGAVPNLSPTAQDRIVFSRLETTECPAVFVAALSPSDASVVAALEAFRRLIPEPDEPRRVVRAPQRNHSSVAVRVDVGVVSILLGADLETTVDPLTGWTAVLDNSAVPRRRAEVFKVAHHGSADADDPRVWAELLTPEPYALVAPFTRTKVPLPTASDRRRICGYTSRGYISSDLAPRRTRRSGVVEKTIKRVTKSIRNVEPPTGHLRLRREKAGTGGLAWTVDKFSGAAKFCRTDAAGSPS